MALATALAAAATIGGAVLSNKSTSKASRRAEQAATRTAEMNNALARDIYSQNQAVLSPYQQRGNVAGGAINALLGLSDIQQPQYERRDGPQALPSNQQIFQGGYSYNPQSHYGGGTIDVGNPRVNALMMNEGGQFDMNSGLPIGGGDYGAMQLGGQSAQPMTGAAPANPNSQYENAFNQYRNSTGYQFRLNEGNKAIGANFAARGLNNSGAAVRSAMNYGQNIASGEFGNYMGLLSNQQGVGLGAASAQAGVGQNYVSNVTANNNNAGSAQANAALLRGQSQANMFGSIAGAAGNIFGSSFGFGR